LYNFKNGCIAIFSVITPGNLLALTHVESLDAVHPAMQLSESGAFAAKVSSA
jgi:hypothetical protein